MLYLSDVSTENRYSNRTMPVAGLLILLSLLFVACQKKVTESASDQGMLNIRFQTEWADAPFVLGEQYELLNGEFFTPTAWKFYVAHLELKTLNGTWVASSGNDYHLMEASTALNLVTTAPPGNYTAVRFLVGVDSTRNVSGVQSGALDPLKGMFWTWNSGYIFVKLEGNSAASTQPNNKVEYHIGGFRAPYNAAQTIEIPLTIAGAPTTLTAHTTLNLGIVTNVSKLFEGSFPVSIAQHPVCMTPGELAWQISGNLQQVFSFGQLAIEE